MTTLSEAIAQGKLKEFIAERKSETGDKDAFDATLRSMVGKSKSDQKTSSRGGSDD